MSDWKEKLNDKVNAMITSKKIKSYEIARSYFEKQFKELTNDLVKRDSSMAVFYENDNRNRFYYSIGEFDLELEKKGNTIVVHKVDEQRAVKLADIIFKNGFSYVKWSEEEEEYLSEESIDKLFREAYKGLWEGIR